MGGLCSKSAKGDKAFANQEEHYDNKKSGGNKNHKHTRDLNLTSAKEGIDNNIKEEEAVVAVVVAAGGTSPDDYYDGIPRYADSFSHESRSVRSRQAAVAKVG